MKKRKAFWDTHLLLYWIEEVDGQIDQVRKLAEWQTKEGIMTVTSSFALAEILVHPIAKGDALVARKYTNVAKRMDCLDFGVNEALAYACIRVDHPEIKPPDCIQLACAVAHGVEYFFTTDRKLSRVAVDGIGEIIYLKDWFDERNKS